MGTPVGVTPTSLLLESTPGVCRLSLWLANFLVARVTHLDLCSIRRDKLCRGAVPGKNMQVPVGSSPQTFTPLPSWGFALGATKLGPVSAFQHPHPLQAASAAFPFPPSPALFSLLF